MIGRIVITSVPQGLGGGAGFQPVLRSKGLRTSLAERLAMRAAYPHPYDFGDPKNPHVLFHRIESVGDRTIHILGSVRDAGSSYTGRSNSLAELLAIDPAETGSLPAGPAFAARGFPWLSRWAGEPREIPLGEEPAIPASDPDDPELTGQPRACTTWASVAGDAGWAGELASSFLDGRSALLYVEQGDDVTALFAEAARLLPLASRWDVTFNTCEIEPFSAHWRAWREGIPIVGPRPSAKDLVLDLSTLRKNGERAPDHDLTQRARGESPSRRPAEVPHQSGTPGGRTNADDEALRAHLKQISDERKRRSMARPTQTSGGPAWNVASILASVALGLAMLVALCVTVIAVGVGVDPGAAQRWFGVRSGDSEADLQVAELRSSAEQEEQDTQSQLEAEKRDQDAEAAAQQERASELAKRNEEMKAAVDKENKRKQEERLSHERMAALAQQVLEKQVREKIAIAQLEADGTEGKVPLRSDTQPSEPDGDSRPLPRAVNLCTFEGCSFADLIDPTIEIACPYEGQDRLDVRPETASLDHTRTWTVTGAFFDSIAGSYEKPVVICRIHGQDSALQLEPLVATSHRLFSRLENSVILVGSKEPGTNVEKIRGQIRLAEPIDMTKRRIILDPLGGAPAGDGVTKDLDQDISRRVEDIPTDRIRWTFVLEHDALPGKKENLDDEDIAETDPRDGDKTSKQLKQTLKLGGADEKGLGLTWGIPESDGTYRDKTVYVRMDAGVTFSLQPLRFEVEPTLVFSPQDKQSILLKNVLTMERLSDIRELGEPMERFKKAFALALMQQPDDYLNTLNSDRLRWVMQRDNLPPPGSLGNPGKTETNTSSYNAAVQDFNNKLNDLWKNKIEPRLNENKRRGEVSADSICSNERWQSGFGVITVRITTCEAIARDSHGNEYRIPIVTEGGD